MFRFLASILLAVAIAFAAPFVLLNSNSAPAKEKGFIVHQVDPLAGTVLEAILSEKEATAAEREAARAEQEQAVAEFLAKDAAERAEARERAADSTVIESLNAMGYRVSGDGQYDRALWAALYDLNFDQGTNLWGADFEVAVALEEMAEAGVGIPVVQPGEVAPRTTQTFYHQKQAALGWDASTRTFSSVVWTHGNEAENDECRGAVEILRRDNGTAPLSRPLIVEHNGCGGEGLLNAQVGDRVELAEGGVREGTYRVVDIQPVLKGSDYSVFESVEGQVIFYTCASNNLADPNMLAYGLVRI